MIIRFNVFLLILTVSINIMSSHRPLSRTHSMVQSLPQQRILSAAAACAHQLSTDTTCPTTFIMPEQLTPPTIPPLGLTNNITSTQLRKRVAFDPRAEQQYQETDTMPSPYFPCAAAACAQHHDPVSNTTTTNSTATHNLAYKAPINPSAQRNLLEAIKNNNILRVAHWLGNGADINKKFDHTDPLSKAIITGNPDTVQALIEMGATVTIKHQKQSWGYFVMQVTKEARISEETKQRLPPERYNILQTRYETNETIHIPARQRICDILDPQHTQTNTFIKNLSMWNECNPNHTISSHRK